MDISAPGVIIGECRGSDFSSKLIEYRGGRFSHSTTLLPGGRFVLDSRADGGVAIRSISYLAKDSIEWFFLSMLTRAQEEAYREAIFSQLAKPYDKDGIRSFINGSILDKDFRTESAWFCDDLIVWALEKCGRIPRLLLPPYKIDPTGLGLILSTAGAQRVRLILKGGALVQW